MSNTATTTAPKAATRTMGAFCWNELHTRDTKRAQEFYTKVVGWTATDHGGSGYTEWKTNAGAIVGGMMAMPPGVPQQVPANWAAYINVEDVDAAAAKAVKLGGKTVSPAMDIPNVGRMCAVADPTGAVFYLFKGVGECGKRVPQDAVQTFCWMELLTSDVAKAEAFYKALFNWTTTPKPMGEFTYTIYWLPGANPAKMEGGVGGMMPIQPEMGPMPSNWLTYIAVDDVDVAADKTAKNGGQVCCPPMDIPNIGRFCVITDPTGATVAFFKSVTRT